MERKLNISNIDSFIMNSKKGRKEWAFIGTDRERIVISNYHLSKIGEFKLSPTPKSMRINLQGGQAPIIFGIISIEYKDNGNDPESPSLHHILFSLERESRNIRFLTDIPGHINTPEIECLHNKQIGIYSSRLGEKNEQRIEIWKEGWLEGIVIRDIFTIDSLHSAGGDMDMDWGINMDMILVAGFWADSAHKVMLINMKGETIYSLLNLTPTSYIHILFFQGGGADRKLGVLASQGYYQYQYQYIYEHDEGIGYLHSHPQMFVQSLGHYMHKKLILHMHSKDSPLFTIIHYKLYAPQLVLINASHNYTHPHHPHTLTLPFDIHNILILNTNYCIVFGLSRKCLILDLLLHTTYLPIMRHPKGSIYQLQTLHFKYADK